MDQHDRASFDHVGFVTDSPQPGEIYLATERCWVTDPCDHPASIEWIRWERDSPHRDDRPHVAFRVPDIEAAIAGRKVLSPPAPTGVGARWAFVEGPDGGVIELLQYDDPDAPGWAGRQGSDGGSPDARTRLST